MSENRFRYPVVGVMHGCINTGYALIPNPSGGGHGPTGCATRDAESEAAYRAARRVFAEGFDFTAVYRHRHEAEAKARELEDVTGYKWALLKCRIGNDEAAPP
jgi:hypothetical protein